MATADADDGNCLPVRVTSYTYDGGPLRPLTTTLTTYDTDGRVVRQAAGMPPGDGPDDTPDEPHVVG